MLNTLLDIKYPIIMAPMFLVSNLEMLIAAGKSGIAGCIPAHNLRTDKDLKEALQYLDDNMQGSYGVNLIVNKSNLKMKGQMKKILDSKCRFIITSLGSPEWVIAQAKDKNILVFCDVTELSYAKKVQDLGADAVIAVNSQAGGHAGKLTKEELIPMLKNSLKIPVISAGGVATGEQLEQTLKLGAIGLSIGSPFIATHESPVSDEYKEACVKYGAKDIILSSKISGTPCTIIKTPYVKKIGTSQSFLEKLLNKNKSLKKWIKALRFIKSMKTLEQAAFGASYKTVWCAGPSIEHVDEICSVEQVVKNIIKGSSYEK